MRHLVRHLVIAAIAAGSLLALLAPQAGASFGIKPGSFHASALNQDGSVDVLAGSHPYEYHVSFEFNANSEGQSEGSARDVYFYLPAGFVGNPKAVPRCSKKLFDAEVSLCPGDTQIGFLRTVIREGNGVLGPGGPIYNLIPPRGVAASFGVGAVSFNIILNASVVRGGRGGYRVAVAANDVPHEYVQKVETTVWGVPAAPGHDEQRYCVVEATAKNGQYIAEPPCASDQPERPFLTLPTACEGPLGTRLEADSLEAPTVRSSEEILSRNLAEEPVGLQGCEALPFEPAFTATPERTSAATPTGLSVDLHVPQPESVTGRAEAELQTASVQLASGLVVNPSSANGLQSCSVAQVALESTEPADCPAASQIGTVEVDTPVLDHPLPGAVYLASQNENPFGSLLAIYIVIDDPESGVVAKLAGHVEPNPVTGQLTTTVTESPQLPFEDFKLKFFGGSRAPLMTASMCGSSSTSASLTPWTSPAEGPVDSSSTMSIISGPNGHVCANTPAQEPNNPTLTAGSTVPFAGAFSPFVLKLEREDGAQELSSFNVTLAPGLLGKIAGIARCPEANIAAAAGRSGREELASPSCPATSELGTVDVAAGAGSEPVHVQGHVYLGGPYEGAPFSLIAITPAVAGPFDLGDVVVRSALRIDPRTAQATVTTDPLPTILQGIPLDVRSVVVNVNRPGFTLNPTNCERMSLGVTVTSSLGQAAPLSSPFQVEACQGLPFKPSFTVATSANTSKAAGASLTTRIAFPKNPSTGLSGEANVAKVRVELPKQLPSRLTTLQKACTEHQFNANPAGCPPESVVGHAVARTPLISVPLEGPAYFVSHGNAAFPELVMVLQGEGITIQLNGETDIKKGITSSTFNQVPDAPVENFVLTLPEGPHSALSAPAGHLCEQSLIMPTRLTGQNGAQIAQNTRIEVEGCPNTIAITQHKIDKHTLTLSLYVPAAGKVTLTGRGLNAKSKTATGRQTITLVVSQKHAGRLKTKLGIVYTPKKGKRQHKALAVTFQK